MDIIQAVSKCTILSYTSFVPNTKDDMNYCTTIKKFEEDMKKLLQEGYICISLSSYFEKLQANNDIKEKCFCIVFQGGYIDNYSLAFPIIKKLKLYASIFVATELMGVSKLENSPNYIPHFGWLEAQSMVNSGLISVHPMWHPMDYEKKLENEMPKKVKLLDSNIKNNNAVLASYYPSATLYESQTLKHLGICLNLVDCFRITKEGWSNGNIPIITVNHTSDIFDTIEQYNTIVHERISKDIFNEKIVEGTVAGADTLYDSVSLPIDYHPIVRNYLRHAFSLSIIQAYRKDRAERIVLSDFIDVVFKPAYATFDFHTYSVENTNGLECMRITKDFFDVNTTVDINTIIINGLKTGFYSDIWLDTYYIPEKPGYKKLHTNHGILIYAYDSRNNTYSALSYANDGKYRTINIPINNLKLGCTNSNFTHVNLLKNRSSHIAEYNNKDLKIRLSNYLNSICIDDNARFNKKSPDQYYNYEASLKFLEYIASFVEKNTDLPLTAVYSYAEQKKTMAWRVQYIATKEDITYDSIDEMADKIKESSEIIVNLAIKYNLTKSKKELEDLKSIIEFLNKTEKCILLDLLSKL